jgi:hypothetical protein
MGVAATSQVLLALGNIICDILSGKIFNLALQWLFGGSKLYFYVTRCRHHLFFSYTTSCRCWHACASFWANFGWLYRQGGGGAHLPPCALLLSSRGTNQNFCHLA